MKKKLGVIGSGQIVPFHLDAALAAGFQLESIGSKASSSSHRELAEKWGGNALSSWEHVLSSDLDALLIASHLDSLEHILETAMSLDIPILCEKPGSLSSERLSQLKRLPAAGKTLFGYNRRHYSSVDQMKNYANTNEPILIRAEAPEFSWTDSYNLAERDLNVLSNTVHFFDLINYLFDGPELEFPIQASSSSHPGFATVVLMTNKLGGRNQIGSLSLSFGSPSNYSISVSKPGGKAVLEPLEFFEEYRGLSVKEPSDENPIRTYSPNSIGRSELRPSEKKFKPGFLGQMRELYSLSEGGSLSELKSATFDDAIGALQFAERVNERLNS